MCGTYTGLDTYFFIRWQEQLRHGRIWVTSESHRMIILTANLLGQLWCSSDLLTSSLEIFVLEDMDFFIRSLKQERWWKGEGDIKGTRWRSSQNPQLTEHHHTHQSSPPPHYHPPPPSLHHSLPTKWMGWSPLLFVKPLLTTKYANRHHAQNSMCSISLNLDHNPLR